MEGQWAAAGGDVSLHNFSARLWEQLVHFHVMRLTDSLFLWVGATPHLRNLAVAMCSRYVSAFPGWSERGRRKGEKGSRGARGEGAVPRLPGRWREGVTGPESERGVWALAVASRRRRGHQVFFWDLGPLGLSRTIPVIS